MAKSLPTIGIIAFLLVAAGTSENLQASDRRHRLGMGLSSKLKNQLTPLSFKIHRSNAFAFGALFAFSNDDKEGGHAAGLKFYRNIFQEPKLNFYGAMTAALLKVNGTEKSTNGFQTDFALGCEFHLTGLNSIGFSFEFGVSLNKLENFVIETTGNNFVTSAVHFYL